MKLQCVRLVLLSFLGLSCGAHAADLPRRADPPATISVPAFSWTGIYAGGALGWVQIDPAAGSNKNGLSYGGFAGYNYQAGQWVLGIEGGIDGWTVGDLRYTDLTGDFLTGHSRWGGTIRGRAGYALDRVLLFATGGAAFISEKASIPGTGVSVGGDGVHWGWTAGAGIDYALTSNWFTGIEYRYSQYDMSSITTAIPLVGVRTFDRELSSNQVTARLGYKF
ncbi:MAG: porin family protein [Bradyrhizobiaceae bacterium]|nr:MAG: porin family protein [Bradyrhizobiaceae bacterium]